MAVLFIRPRRRAKPSTVERQFGVLRAIVNYAIDCELIVKAPCRGIKLPEGVEKDAYIVDAAEFAALADAMDEHTRPGANLDAYVLTSPEGGPLDYSHW